MVSKLKPAGIFLSLFIVPYFATLLYYYYFDKDVIYLRGGGLSWMRNPEENHNVDNFPEDFPAEYEIKFDLLSKPTVANLKISAVKSHILRVNDSALSTEEGTLTANWKTPVEYNILSYLKPGRNVISVYVHAPRAIAALKVAGSVTCLDGTKIDIDSLSWWLVRSIKTFLPKNITGDWEPVELCGSVDEPFHPEILIVYGAFFLTILLFIPRIWEKLGGLFAKSWISRAMPNLSEKAWNICHKILYSIIFLTLLFVAVHNFITYPAKDAGDYRPHLDYLNNFASSWHVPLATEGFQMYNPPLLYLLSGILYRVAAGLFRNVEQCAQLINSISLVLMMLMIFLMLKRIIKNDKTLLIVILVMSFIPMNLYRAPAIAGDTFHAFLWTVIFYAFYRYLDEGHRKWVILCGVITGAAFLTRYTALFGFLGLLAGFAYTIITCPPAERRVKVIDAILLVGLVFLISGWYYVRNIVYLHQVFPVNGQKDLFFFSQMPGFRDWDFYINIKKLFTDDPRSKDYIDESFFAGSYGTFWADPHHFFLNSDNFLRRRDVTLGIYGLIALGLLPTSLFILGVYQSIKRASRVGGAYRALLVASIAVLAFSIEGYTLASYSKPHYSIIKSFYLLYIMAPLSLFFAEGLKKITNRSGWLVVSIWCVALSVISVSLFLY